MSTSPDRHISPATFDDYVGKGAAATIPIPGTPEALLTIDPQGETIRLEVAWDGEAAPEIADYLHISSGVHFRNGANWSTIQVHGSQYFAESYPLLCSVANLVQEDGQLFAAAVTQSLASYHDLLAATAPMPERDEIGLFGELLVLMHLINTVGPVTALMAWRGGDEVEEHDVGLPEGDVEIKTTTSERRRHWISSLTQLVPSAGRPLWLLSIQLTGAGAGHAMRLPDLIDRIASDLPSPLDSDFRTRLDRTSYRPSQPRERFRLVKLRSEPLVFRVNDEFPRIDPSILQNGGAKLSNLGEVSYVISLDDVKPVGTMPDSLAGLGTGMSQI